MILILKMIVFVVDIFLFFGFAASEFKKIPKYKVNDWIVLFFILFLFGLNAVFVMI